MKNWNRRDWGVLLALTALAAALRFYRLGQVPPGFQFDEAYNALDAARVLAGQRPLFLPPNGGREVVYTYLQSALAALLGLNLYTLRLTSALAGILSIPAAYVLLRVLLRRHSRGVAAFTALAMAVSFWHLHFSHYGIRVILMPLVFSGVCGCFWLAAQRRSPWLFALSGALAGFSVWVHPTGRLIPFVLAGYLLWHLWLTRRAPDAPPGAAAAARRSLLVGALISGAVAFLVFLPLGIEFYRHPDFFFGHASKVSVFALTAQDYTVAGAVLRHVLAVLGMFNVGGDVAWIHNLAGRPVFDLFMSIPFLLGLWLWVRRLFQRGDPDRDALGLLALWSIVMLLPSVFSDMPPNFSRTLPALPAIFVAAGLGLDALAGLRLPMTRITPGWLRTRAGGLLALLIVSLSAGLAFRDYFYVFPAQAGAYYNYDVDKLDAWSYIQAAAPGNYVYISQLWGEHATIEYLRRQTPNIKSLDTTDTIVLPPAGLGAVYVFPAQQRDRATALAKLWPHAVLEPVQDRYGGSLIDAVRIPAADLQTWPTGLNPERAVAFPFEGGPALLGMRSAGSEIDLFWQATAPMATSYTTFVHLLDGQRRRVAQVDKLPGNGSYPTSAWTPGERIIERYHLAAPFCVTEAPLQAVAGWYDLAAGSRPLLRAGGGTVAPAGEVRLPAVPYAVSLVRPEPIKSPPPGDLDTLRIDLQGDDGLQAGAPFALDIYLRGGAEAADRPMTVRLVPGATGPLEGGQILWQGTVMPAGVEWRVDQALCRHVELNLPVDAAAGAYRVAIDAGGRLHGWVDLTLGQATRRFDAPQPAHPISATLGDAVRLLGYDLSSPAHPGQPLQVTLAWQALAAGQPPYSVFVHMVDGAGKIICQSDAAPADGYGTDHWIAGEYVTDTHTLAVPPGTPPGRYHLLAGMYDPLGGARLPAAGPDGETWSQNAVPLGEVEVQ